MTADFDAWIDSLYPPDHGDPGHVPVGVMEVLRATFNTRGAVGWDVLDEVFQPLAMQLAHDAVALFMADVARTSMLTPTIEIYRDEADSIAVSWNGNYSTPVFFAMRTPETTCEVADNLRDHVVDDLGAAWPLCPTHGFGLYPDPINGQAVWFCRYADHAVSAIGQLPISARASEG